jgi:flagellar hook-basal body complex protein FliE
VRVEPIVPDLPAAPKAEDDGADFARALDAVGNALNGATRAEDAFAYGTGTLDAAVYERARADVALSVATATAQRLAQAIQSVLNMQI